jgi:hypothetical protein
MGGGISTYGGSFTKAAVAASATSGIIYGSPAATDFANFATYSNRGHTIDTSGGNSSGRKRNTTLGTYRCDVS